MNFLHAHAWETVGTNYHAALPMTMNSQMPEDVGPGTDERRYGVTFVTLRCSGCGLVNQERIVGHFKANGIEETTN